MTFRQSTRLAEPCRNAQAASVNTRLRVPARGQLDASLEMNIVAADAFDLPLNDHKLESGAAPGAIALAEDKRQPSHALCKSLATTLERFVRVMKVQSNELALDSAGGAK